MVKQISLDTWSIQHLTNLLQKAALIVTKTNSPIVLYRQTLEEEEGSYEEIVCTLNGFAKEERKINQASFRLLDSKSFNKVCK